MVTEPQPITIQDIANFGVAVLLQVARAMRDANGQRFLRFDANRDLDEPVAAVFAIGERESEFLEVLCHAADRLQGERVVDFTAHVTSPVDESSPEALRTYANLIRFLREPASQAEAVEEASK